MNGLKARFEALKAWWNGAVGFFSRALTTKNEIKSPSRLFMRHGGHIIEGLAIGLAKNAPKAENEIESLFGRLNADSGNVNFTANNGRGSVNAGGSGGITIHYNQTVNVQGNNPEQIREAIKMSFRDFEQMMKQYMFEQNRRSYS